MIRKFCVYKLKEAKKKKIATLRPLVTEGIAPEAAKGEDDDDNDSGISSHGTPSNGNGSIPSPDLSKTELARRLSNASLRNPAYLKVKVLWDFEPRLQNTELKVTKGEIVHLLYRDCDRALAVNRHGKRGFIPFNFCSLPHRKIDANLSKESWRNTPSSSVSKPRKQLWGEVSFKEFLDDMDLLNKKSVTGKHPLSSKSHSDFKRLQTKCFSEEGISGNTSSSSDSEDEPLCYRKTSGVPDMIFWNRKALERFRQRQKMNVSHFRKSINDMYMLVLYTFYAQQENDIDVYKGDIVRVLNRDDKDWWWVVTSTGREGFVPSIYLTRRSVVPSSSGPSTSCSVESSSSTSEASSTQAVRFQDPLCTFHRYEKEEWETDAEVSGQNPGGRSMVGMNELESIDEDSDSRWSTWC